MIDLVITLPNNVVFTLWSNWITKNQFRFNKVYVALHQKNIEGYDFTEEIKRLLKDVKNVVFIEGINPMDGSDWRNEAINKCLDLSESEYVLFMEPDVFLSTNTVFSLLEKNTLEDNVCWMTQQGRIHPALLLVPRMYINETDKDFSPVETDHFGKFTRELKELHYIPQTSTGYIPGQLYFHMNGLTQNFTLLELGQVPNHDLPNFIEYCKNSIVFGGSQKYSELVEKAISLEVNPQITHYLQDYL